MKRWFALCLLLLFWAQLVPALAQSAVLNRTDNLTEEYLFPEETPVLEVVFPRVYSSDCAILRFGGEVMMIDTSRSNDTMQLRVQTALASMGVERIHTLFNSHPHDDHINGLPYIHAHTPIDQLILTFPEDYDPNMARAVEYARDSGIPIVHVQDGDVLTMGEHGEVTLTVIQRWGNSAWGGNDQSAMLLVQYGERTILFTGDVEERAQKSYIETPPACGLKADILKYPHHGQVKLISEFMDMIDPELSFMNGAAEVMDESKAFLERRNIPYLLGYKGLTRMRTDGQVWVVDYLYEIETDRQTLQPEYR